MFLCCREVEKSGFGVYLVADPEDQVSRNMTKLFSYHQSRKENYFFIDHKQFTVFTQNMLIPYIGGFMFERIYNTKERIFLRKSGTIKAKARIFKSFN